MGRLHLTAVHRKPPVSLNATNIYLLGINLTKCRYIDRSFAGSNCLACQCIVLLVHISDPNQTISVC